MTTFILPISQPIRFSLKNIPDLEIRFHYSLNPIKPGLFEICHTWGRGGGGIHPRPVTPLFEG